MKNKSSVFLLAFFMVFGLFFSTTSFAEGLKIENENYSMEYFSRSVSVNDNLISRYNWEDSTNGDTLTDVWEVDGYSQDGTNPDPCIYSSTPLFSGNNSGDYSCVSTPSVVSKTNLDFSKSFTINYWIYNSGGDGIHISTRSNGQSAGIEALVPGSGTDFEIRVWDSSNNIHTASASFPKNEWVMLSYVGDYNSSEIKVYVNGTLSGTNSSWNGTISATSRDIGIGERPSSTFDANSSSVFDDLRFYATALTSTQIQNIYNNTKP
jgi:hypothetical protein